MLVDLKMSEAQLLRLSLRPSQVSIAFFGSSPSISLGFAALSAKSTQAMVFCVRRAILFISYCYLRSIFLDI